MNKLETITQLLVNELTDFEANVNRLENGLQRAEDLKVKFDLAPIDNLVSELKSFQQRETEDREAYVNRLNRKLENAKIYPQWAVITFLVAMGIVFGSLYFAYEVQSNFEKKTQQAYQQGINDYEKFMNGFFKENPKTFNIYKKWKEK